MPFGLALVRAPSRPPSRMPIDAPARLPKNIHFRIWKPPISSIAERAAQASMQPRAKGPREDNFSPL